MISRIYITAFLLTVSSIGSVFAQKLNYTGKFRHAGYINNEPIFWLYDDKSDNNTLYKISQEKDVDILGFKPVKTLGFSSQEVLFIHNDILVRGEGKKRDQYIISIYQDSILVDQIQGLFETDIVYSEKSRILFLFFSDDKRFLTAEIDLSKAKPQVNYIPIKADRAYLEDDWLYFSFFHEQYEYSPWPHDIFRVKIGNWLNPELVFEGSEYDEWFLYPEQDVIGTDIELNVLISNEKSNESQILYNVETESYAIIPNLYSKNILRYDGQYYTFFKKRDNTRGIETIGLKALPELPEKYPYTENEVLPREVWYNVPIKEKTFDGTFITPYLLREAPRAELSKLDNSQLRLLRNALYAQYGYVFNSKDLQEFYNQFEWYRMMTAKREKNDNIILLSEDEKRAEMIREIELE